MKHLSALETAKREYLCKASCSSLLKKQNWGCPKGR